MTPLQAVRAKCLNCSAGQPSEVRLCPCTNCALHPFRMGRKPQESRRELTEEARAALAARLRGGRASTPQKQAQNAGSVDGLDGEALA